MPWCTAGLLRLRGSVERRRGGSAWTLNVSRAENVTVVLAHPFETGRQRMDGNAKRTWVVRESEGDPVRYSTAAFTLFASVVLSVDPAEPPRTLLDWVRETRAARLKGDHRAWLEAGLHSLALAPHHPPPLISRARARAALGPGKETLAAPPPAGNSGAGGGGAPGPGIPKPTRLPA